MEVWVNNLGNDVNMKPINKNVQKSAVLIVAFSSHATTVRRRKEVRVFLTNVLL